MADPVTATGGYQLVPVTRNDGETVYVRADKVDAPVMAAFNARGQRSNRDLKRDDVSGAPEGSGFWDTGLGRYLRNSYEGLSRGAKAVREATDPFQYAKPAAEAATSMLPGAGLVEGQQDFGRMGQALKDGRYRDAAIDAGYGLVNAGTEFIPAMAAMPAIRRGGVSLTEGAPPPPSNVNVSQQQVRDMIPEPLPRQDRDWQNYGRNMSPDEVMGSEPVWGAAATAEGQGRAEAFAEAANDMWRRMGANRYITPEIARRYMATEEAKMRGIAPVGD
jgi:hypothetical protein